MNWFQSVIHQLGNRSPVMIPRQVVSQLHPELSRRLEPVLQDLKNRGWNPVVSTVPGSAFRTAAQQGVHLRAGRSAVPFSAHQVSGPHGEKWSMAAHIFDPSVGTNPSSDHAFSQDLQTAAERNGLRSGRPWHTSDPLHVQLIGAPPYHGEHGALRKV